MTFRLVDEAGATAVEVPPGRSVLVGRSPGCDLRLADATVSRRHGELLWTRAGVKVTDLGSTNGTFVGEERVTEAVVPAGGRIVFGKVVFGVDSPPPAPPPEEDALDATILRQVRVHPPAGIAARLAVSPGSGSQLKIAAGSPAERQARQLALLLDVGKELSGQADVGRLLDKVVALTFQVMSVDRVAILTLSPAGELTPRVERCRDGVPSEDFRVARSVAVKTVSERLAVLIENAPKDGRFGGSAQLASVQSALCAPLIGGQGTVLGLIYLDNVGFTHSFGAEDLEFLTAFSGMVAVGIENSQLIERVRREAVALSNFQRYFAPELAAQIAAEEGAVQLGGSRRRVAVLFADIRGFTALSEALAPDEIARLLNEYFSEMVEIVFAHGGTLDKFIGDALMALWGTPLSGPDDADRAVAAAVALQRGLARLNARWAREGRRTLSVGIGLNFGEVFAGNIGSDRRLDFTVIGDAVNLAAHLCGRAGPEEILVAEPLFAALSRPPAATEIPPLALKGRSQAVRVYRADWR